MSCFHIDLHQKMNSHCQRCQPEKRNENQEDYLCRLVKSMDDGKSVRCVGSWAYEKIFRLVQYFGIFTKGMANKWEGKLNYIEICSGPGRCVLRESGEEVDGTALAIARHPSFKTLHAALFIDHNPRVVEILDGRLSQIENCAERKTRVIRGDFTCKQDLRKIFNAIPEKHLNLVFIDPTECNVPFSTIELAVQSLKRADFIINVALGTDVNRNLVPAFLDSSFSRAKEKYTAFLGSETFFADENNQKLAVAGNTQELRRSFLDEYQRQLKRIGLAHTDSKNVKAYYHLVFASGDPRGLDFWHKANKIEPDGQRTFDFL